jgi:tetratricopeptide (TPR) repeat protein
MSRLTWAPQPRTFARALLLLLAAVIAAGASAADLVTLQGHATGRRALVDGDLGAAQSAWDAVLANRKGSLFGISLERTCDRAELAMALGRRRSLSPVWVAGTDCATLVWGAFASAEEAEAQLAALPAGVLPAGASVVELVPPLAVLSVEAPPPGPLATVARAAPELQPSTPRVTAPREPEVVESPAPEPERPAEPEPAADTPAEPEPATPAPREVVPEPMPPAPEAEAVRARPVPDPRRAEPEPAPAPSRPATPVRRPEPLREAAAEEAAPPLPTEPEGLTEAEREERRIRAAESFAEGNALWAGGDYEAAIAAFETALELDPNNPRILNNLGTAWLKADRPARAVSVLARAVELDPLYARAFLNLSTALYAAKRPEEALDSLQRVIDLEPANLDARYNKAAVLAELRRWPDARAALVEGLDIAPGDNRLLEFLQQVDQQIAVLGPAGAEAPAAATAPDSCSGIASDVMRARRAGELFGVGESASASADWAAAEAAYVGVLDCDPTSSAAANRLGVARLRRGDAPGARQAFDLASRLDPEHLEARANSCLAAYAADSCQAAASCLQGLTNEAAGFGPGWRELALMLYRCGSSIEAESAAVRGLELLPDDARLRGLLERIEGERIAAPR